MVKRMVKGDENEVFAVHVAPQRPVLLPKPRETVAEIMTFGCRGYQDSAENLRMWEIFAATNRLAEKDEAQLLPGYVKGGTKRFCWETYARGGRSVEHLRRYSFQDVTMDADHGEAFLGSIEGRD